MAIPCNFRKLLQFHVRFPKATIIRPLKAKHLEAVLQPRHREALRARGVAEHPQDVLGEEVAVEVPEDFADGLAVSWDVGPALLRDC